MWLHQLKRRKDTVMLKKNLEHIQFTQICWFDDGCTELQNRVGGTKLLPNHDSVKPPARFLWMENKSIEKKTCSNSVRTFHEDNLIDQTHNLLLNSQWIEFIGAWLRTQAFTKSKFVITFVNDHGHKTITQIKHDLRLFHLLTKYFGKCEKQNLAIGHLSTWRNGLDCLESFVDTYVHCQ